MPPRFASDRVFLADTLVLTWVLGDAARGVDAFAAWKLYKQDLNGAQVVADASGAEFTKPVAFAIRYAGQRLIATPVPGHPWPAERPALLVPTEFADSVNGSMLDWEQRNLPLARQLAALAASAGTQGFPVRVDATDLVEEEHWAHQLVQSPGELPRFQFLAELCPPEVLGDSGVDPSRRIRAAVVRASDIGPFPKTLKPSAFLGGNVATEGCRGPATLSALAEQSMRGLQQVALDLDALDTVLVGHGALGQLMHAHGVNLRHLGRLATTVTIPAVRDMVVVDLLARTGKQLLSAELGCRCSVERVLAFFNRAVGESPAAVAFWDVLAAKAAERFACPAQLLARKLVHRLALFHALQFHCGIGFLEPHSLDQRTPLQPASLRAADFPHADRIEGLLPGWYPRTRAVFAAPPCLALAQQAAQHLKAGRVQKAYVSANLALECSARLSEPLDEALTAVAHSLLRLAEAQGPEAARKAVAVAALAAERSAPAASLRAKVVRVQAHFLAGEPREAQAEYEEAVALIRTTGGNELLLMHIEAVMARRLFERAAFEACLPHVATCCDLSARLLGQTHAVTNAYLTRKGQTLLKVRSYKEAALAFEKAAAVAQHGKDLPAQASNEFLLAFSRVRLGQPPGAERAARAALKIWAELGAAADVAQVQHLLGRLLHDRYATSLDAAAGREAVELLEAWLGAVGPGDARVDETTGIVLALSHLTLDQGRRKVLASAVEGVTGEVRRRSRPSSRGTRSSSRQLCGTCVRLTSGRPYQRGSGRRSLRS